jgi:glycylpeptide N-tetradecanoyltransferase
VIKTKKLVGFISGIPADLMVNGIFTKLVEINFLCVHKKLRSKRLAPVLIKEVTRRVNLTGIFQAVYTAGVLLTQPVGTCRYYHRSLNPKKLCEVGFSSIGRNQTMSQLIKYYKLGTEKLPGLRLMENKDVAQVQKLLWEYHQKFEFASQLSEEEVRHWLLPREDVVYSYVLENESGKITDFISFYILNSSILGNANHTHVNAAYLFYYVPNNMGKDDDRIRDLIHDALKFAKEV